MESLSGKVAIVTGSGTGIGKATALLLASSGANIVCIGRRSGPIGETAAEIEKNGGRAIAVSADFETDDGPTTVSKATLEAFGRIDILVNNAGHSSKMRSILRVEPKEWRSVFLVNVEGLYRLTQSVLPHMIKQGGGTVITISSMAALNPTLLGGAPYGAAKAASYNLMKFLTSELRNSNIRATTIFPAEVDTPILANRPLPPDATARATMMQPEDIADAVLLCAALPLRTQVEELIISPTKTRDISQDIEAARKA